jgi:hypothetical protein
VPVPLESYVFPLKTDKRTHGQIALYYFVTSSVFSGSSSGSSASSLSHFSFLLRWTNGRTDRKQIYMVGGIHSSKPVVFRGSGSGSCASSFGVCCVFEVMLGKVTGAIIMLSTRHHVALPWRKTTPTSPPPPSQKAPTVPTLSASATPTSARLGSISKHLS